MAHVVKLPSNPKALEDMKAFFREHRDYERPFPGGFDPVAADWDELWEQCEADRITFSDGPMAREAGK